MPLGYHLTEITKKKLSEIRKGSKNPMYGVHLIYTDEHRRKDSESHKGSKNPNFGKVYSLEEKNKISEATRGIYKSEDWKKKASIAKLGKKNPNFGKSTWITGGHWSPETLIKIQKSSLNRLIKKPTKPQLKLLEVVKTTFPNREIVMEQSVKISNGHFFFIDVAIPSLKIGFEYDCPYWHQNLQRDIKRHDRIQGRGLATTSF